MTHFLLTFFSGTRPLELPIQPPRSQSARLPLPPRLLLPGRQPVLPPDAGGVLPAPGRPGQPPAVPQRVLLRPGRLVRGPVRRPSADGELHDTSLLPDGVLLDRGLSSGLNEGDHWYESRGCKLRDHVHLEFYRMKRVQSIL